LPVVQSALEVQLVLHDVVLQRKPPQLAGAPLHEPAPLQVDTLVSTPSTHVFAPQLLLPVGYLQPVGSTPLQVAPHSLPAPVPPHAARAPCGGPLTVVQVPTLPVASHAWH
jgi:hypothetical protein